MYTLVIESSSVKPNKSRTASWLNLNLQNLKQWQMSIWAHVSAEWLDYRRIPPQIWEPQVPVQSLLLPTHYIIRTNHNSRIWNGLLSKQLNAFYFHWTSVESSWELPHEGQESSDDHWLDRAVTHTSHTWRSSMLFWTRYQQHQISAVNPNLCTNTWCLYVNILYIPQIYIYSIYCFTIFHTYIHIHI